MPSNPQLHASVRGLLRWEPTELLTTSQADQSSCRPLGAEYLNFSVLALDFANLVQMVFVGRLIAQRTRARLYALN